MDPNTVLTEAQREALRLVAKGFGSKDIARILGRSHHSVDRRIERAMQNLGAASRFSAARMLIEAEGGTYELLTREPSPLGVQSLNDMVGPPDDAAERPPEGETEGGQAPSPGIHSERISWPFPSGRGDRAPLGLKTRLFWALIGLPILMMIAWGLLLAGIAALDTLKV